MEKFLSVLKCLKCQSQAEIVYQQNNYLCSGCKAQYPLRQGIADFTLKDDLRLPKIYQDHDYKRWAQSLAENQDYFYRRNSLVEYVQGAGHRIINQLRRQNNYDLVLDLGCGDGAHYPYLTQPQNSFGLDLDQQSLEKLKKNYPDYFVVRANGYDLPIKDASVDCIINIYNLEHMVYLDFVLEEMVRILKPKGEVFIAVPCEGGMLWSLGRNISTVRKFTSSGLNYRRAIAIEHINCIWQLDKAIRRYFRVLNKVCFPFKVPIFHLNLIAVYRCQLS